MSDSKNGAAVYIEDLSKSFGEVEVLKNINLKTLMLKIFMLY